MWSRRQDLGTEWLDCVVRTSRCARCTCSEPVKRKVLRTRFPWQLAFAHAPCGVCLCEKNRPFVCFPLCWLLVPFRSAWPLKSAASDIGLCFELRTPRLKALKTFLAFLVSQGPPWSCPVGLGVKAVHCTQWKVLWDGTAVALTWNRFFEVSFWSGSVFFKF